MEVAPDPADAAIQRASPALWEALSPLGLRLRLPANFLPQQTAEARGKTYNATIGQITDGRGRAVPLPTLDAALGGLDAAARSRAFLYSPVEGLPELRRGWRERQREGRPAEVPSSLPLVTAGPTHALSLTAELFLAPGRTVLLPDPGPEGYADVFTLRTRARAAMVPAGASGVPGARELAAALADLPAGEPAMAALRIPAERGGPAPTPTEREALVRALVQAAEARPLVAVLDDVWEGTGPAARGGSLFWDLAGRHPRLVALKVEGADGELGFPGGGIGFLTLPFPPEAEVTAALEGKIKLLLRAVVGSPPAASQAILLRALGGR